MSKDLIIVESPAKVKTIKKFLGSEYIVDASVGHVRDLPRNALGVDEEKDFEPSYQVISGKKKIVSRLRKEAAESNQVFLAPDPDREGEAIAWHIAELIKDKNNNISRIQFNQITKKAVQEALLKPRDLDENLFNSQQARRILDRLVGYKISPLLWKKVKRGLSAGRVQSVALRLIVDRERERQAFVPQEYWTLKVVLQDIEHPESTFEAELWKLQGKKAVVSNAEQAATIEHKVKDSPFAVSSLEEKERLRHPKPPFITSTMQQEANKLLNFSAKRTMSLAQNLYEGLELGKLGTTALVTYIRTDSFRVAPEAKKEAKDWITSQLGKEYYPSKERFYKSKGSAQDAHEAIRPVDVTLTPNKVKPYLSQPQWKLYKLIWSRFVASQMASAKFWDTQVVAESAKTQWRAKGERLVFPGFLKIYAGSDARDTQLPELHKGQKLSLKNFDKQQKFTQPPARFSEATLVKKLEEKGIGRPSTYATIISTLVDRDYVGLEKRLFYPTELGKVVNDLLVEHFTKLLDIGFTAEMETALDGVAEGSQDWKALLGRFYGDFESTLGKAKESMASIKGGLETDIKCEECGKPMVIKFGKNGSFLACSGYPDCKNTKNFTRDDQGNIQVEADQIQDQVKVGTCPECQGDLIVKHSRAGARFIACANYPKCKYTMPFTTGVSCPEEDCSGELVEKSTRRGKVFFACNQFPQCTYALWDRPVNEPCPSCGFPLLVQKTTKAKGDMLACPQKECTFKKPVSTEE